MTQTVYFGTYTRRKSEGIYKADFDTNSGLLSNLTLVAKESSPTYLAFDKAGFLYSVGAENGQGGIAAFDPQKQLINHVVDEGAPLCYVSVDEKRHLVYGANYHKGQVLVYRRLANGSLELADTVSHKGAGPHENQASAHVHFADLTPDQYLVSCDLGTDEVTTYTVSENGTIHLLDTYKCAAGAGARHLVFHHYQKMAYLICELNSTIEVLIYDGVGQFERLQTVSTIPEDFTGANGTAAIRISADGKFLYSSNRGHDSIAVYKIANDGCLELVEIIPTKGKTPRDFNITPDQQYIIAVHQDSDNATVFKRDSETGKLTEISHDFYVPEAVCVTFYS